MPLPYQCRFVQVSGLTGWPFGSTAVSRFMRPAGAPGTWGQHRWVRSDDGASHRLPSCAPPARPSPLTFIPPKTAGNRCFKGDDTPGQSLTTQAQRPGPRGRAIATWTRWPQRMVGGVNMSISSNSSAVTVRLGLSRQPGLRNHQGMSRTKKAAWRHAG